ncbi:MAG TPA: hypothetical protein VM370_01010 [Candidatus Thermoplasmatota archaeon]|nr:hypothetical protein [Candidatus Thermoplasmatota archaeon]
MDVAARRRARLPALALGGALAWLAFGGGWSALLVAATAAAGVYATGGATHTAAGYGYAVGCCLAGAGLVALAIGPAHDVGFFAFALGTTTVGAWLARGAVAPITGASASARRRRSA